MKDTIVSFMAKRKITPERGEQWKLQMRIGRQPILIYLLDCFLFHIMSAEQMRCAKQMPAKFLYFDSRLYST